MTVIQQVAPSENQEETLKELHRLFNDQGHSDYVVVYVSNRINLFTINSRTEMNALVPLHLRYLRLITSGQLQEGAEFYQNFIDGHCTMEEFRHQEVEPMYKESDHIHIIGERNQKNELQSLADFTHYFYTLEYLHQSRGCLFLCCVCAANESNEWLPSLFNYSTVYCIEGGRTRGIYGSRRSRRRSSEGS